jgi:hypothetical protein
MNQSKSILVRLRTSFGGRLGGDGSLNRYSAAEIKGARDRALVAEDYLYHPEKLESLRGTAGDLAVVRDYVEQCLDANLALTDPPRFRWMLRGVTRFCLLGLGGQATSGTNPAPAEQWLEQEPLTGLDYTARRQIVRWMAQGIDSGVAVVQPQRFEHLMRRLESFCLAGLHRLDR